MLGFQEFSWNVLELLFNSNYLSLLNSVLYAFGFRQVRKEQGHEFTVLQARWMSPLFEHTTAAAPPRQLLWVEVGMESHE